jgi:hypothetical protein
LQVVTPHQKEPSQQRPGLSSFTRGSRQAGPALTPRLPADVQARDECGTTPTTQYATGEGAVPSGYMRTWDEWPERQPTQTRCVDSQHVLGGLNDHLSLWTQVHRKDSSAVA